MVLNNPYNVVWNTRMDRMLLIRYKMLLFIENADCPFSIDDVERFKRYYVKNKV